MIGIYARVSTEEQAKKGFSLRDQLRECRNKAGCEDVLEYIDEGISGEILDRPALTKLRNDVQRGIITKVICLDPDRLSRKLGNQLLLADEIEKKAELIFINGEYGKTPEGILFFQLRGAIAEFEKAKIKERMSRGRREKARQGKVLRNYNIYGYDYDPDTQQLVINEYEAQVVRMIFQLFTENNPSIKGITGIANHLTQLGIPTKKHAAAWSKQVVRQILMNRTYIGEFYHNRWNTEGMLGNKYKDFPERIPIRKRPKEEWILVRCPPIVEKDVFLYAQKILEQSRRRWAGTSKRNYLLSGLLRCGICGNTMTGRKSSNWGKTIYEYTDKKRTAKASHQGCGTRIKAEDLESAVWSLILQLLIQESHRVGDRVTSEEKLVTSFEEKELNRINKELHTVASSRKNLIHALSCIAPELGEADIKEIQQQIYQLRNKEEQLLERKKAMQARQQNQKDDIHLNLPQHAVRYYLYENKHLITNQDKKNLIRMLIREIVLGQDEIRIFFF
ncbi:MAG: recombinase family protein [Clostridia bacterium]